MSHRTKKKANESEITSDLLDPVCDICAEDGIRTPATVDGRTKMGPWANMCDAHHRRHGVGLGPGKGQRKPAADH